MILRRKGTRPNSQATALTVVLIRVESYKELWSEIQIKRKTLHVDQKDTSNFYFYFTN